VKYLSGGERSRLLLARILKHGGNFLILDEPTNDLDLPTLRVLEEALIAFPGVVVVVSHDRYFLNRVCTSILAFEGESRVTFSVGDYDYYVEKRSRLQDVAQHASAPGSAKTASAKPEKIAKSRTRRLSFKESRELNGMEEVILGVEENIGKIEALFADPEFHRKNGQRTAALTGELACLKGDLTRLYERWEELEEIRSGAQQDSQS